MAKKEIKKKKAKTTKVVKAKKVIKPSRVAAPKKGSSQVTVAGKLMGRLTERSKLDITKTVGFGFIHVSPKKGE